MSHTDGPDEPTETIAAVPSWLDVQAEREAAREQVAANQAIVDGFPRHMRRIARSEGEKAGKREGRKFGLVGLIVCLLVSFGASALATSAYLNAADLRTVAQQRQEQVDAALTKLDEANHDLQARGQQPVATPTDGDPNEAIAAAVLARVIAQLPPTPTAEQVASAIVPAVTANVLGPSQRELAAQVSAYFAQNPPQPGPPPSQAEIDAAVQRALAANPPPKGDKGEKGDKGDKGEAGTNGVNGTNGVDGKPGPACPDGYTPTEATVVTTDGPKASILCQPS